METHVKRYAKVYPWYYGFTADLLFYIAIDTLFLTLVKNFSAAEIVSITSISQLACIVLQFPILFIIKKIGNTASVRTGAFFLLLSSLLITFGTSYAVVLLGRIFHDIATSFQIASVAALENNLDLVDKKGDFIKIRASANTVYAVLTMLIAFVASFMFNLNPYLPMIGCITTCALGFIASLFMKDCSVYNKIEKNKESGTKVKIHYSKMVILGIVLYAVFYSIVSNGQSEGKLFIQQNLLLDFDVETTALIIGAIVCASRIVRVLSNVIFDKLYRKYQEKMGVALTALLCTSFACLLFGSLIPQIIVKILVMALGYAIILFLRDPFKLYMQDVLFDITPKEQHQTLLAIKNFGVKILSGGLGLVFSAILLSWPMLVVMAILLAISVMEIVLGIILYRMVLLGKRSKAEHEAV